MNRISEKEKIWRKKFGDKLKRLIHLKGMTQKEFAEELGIIDTTVSKYIRGDRCPDIYRILKIANILDCDPNCLFDVDD